MPEALAVDRGAAIEEGAEQDRELRCDLLAESCQNIQADDEGDAGDAQQCAGQLQRRERLVARHQQGAEAHENRRGGVRSEEQTSELQSLMRVSYAVYCLQKN